MTDGDAGIGPSSLGKPRCGAEVTFVNGVGRADADFLGIRR